LFERFAVNLEFPAAGTKKYTRDRRLAAARSVVLNSLCHFSLQPRASSFEQPVLEEVKRLAD
jgi:hypothetical protein